MSRTDSDLSLADLEAMVEKKRAALEKLIAEREKVQKSLDAINEKIGSIEGKASRSSATAAATSTASASPADGTTAAAPAKARRGPRPKNEKPLWGYVTDILGKQKKGLSLSELAEKIMESGYQTKSSNFTNVLYQCLYNHDEVKHDSETGTYKLQA